MQDERLTVGGPHQAGQLVLLLGGVDVGVAGVVEDPEQAVQTDVDAGGLDQGTVEGLDPQPPGGDLGADVTVGEQHARERIAPRRADRRCYPSSATLADVVQWQNISFPS